MEGSLQLTRFTDYAIRLLIFLALEAGRPVTVGLAAEHLRISKHHLVKVANLLMKNGYILGIRGRTGGIQLKKSSDDISLGEIVRLTERGLTPVECMSASGSCSLEGVCGCPHYLHRAMEAFLRELDRATLDSVARSSRNG
jgi:Rrf2 family nitric oxide-sensitive transcriptional repressor